jgi:peptidyl-tRNA hydrolase, PTH1 family
MTIKLIVGLGNPGNEYAHTRHNMGADLLARIADKYKISLKVEGKFAGELGKGIIENTEVKLLLPSTYMNESGRSVGAVATFYKIAPDEILVLHDELDLAPGIAKFKTGGGAGGHNGLKSIISCLGNNQNFNRLRIGIGHPVTKPEMINFVLGLPPKAEREMLDQVIDEAVDCISLIYTQNLAKATNRLNGFKVTKN